jgi:hypothetical protein
MEQFDSIPFYQIWGFFTKVVLYDPVSSPHATVQGNWRIWMVSGSFDPETIQIRLILAFGTQNWA